MAVPEHLPLSLSLSLPHTNQTHTQKKPLTGAAHAAEVVVDDAAGHLEVVHDHRAQGRGGVEQRAVDDEHADLARLHAGLAERLLDRREADLLELPARVRHADARRRHRQAFFWGFLGGGCV